MYKRKVGNTEFLWQHDNSISLSVIAFSRMMCMLPIQNCTYGLHQKVTQEKRKRKEKTIITDAEEDLGRNLEEKRKKGNVPDPTVLIDLNLLKEGN